MLTKKLLVYKSRVRANFALILWVFFGWLFASGLRGRVRVIVFHHVDEPQRFARLVGIFKRRYNVISWAQFLAGSIALDKLNVIFSFDDGYASWVSVAAPVLKKYNIYPLFFLNSGLVALDDAKTREFYIGQVGTWPEPRFCASDVSILIGQGWEIGGHTKDHEDLTLIHDAPTLFEIIRQDRDQIMKLFNVDCRCFAYPFGRYNNLSISAAQEAGYSYAFTSDPFCFVNLNEALYTIPRVNIGMRNGYIAAALVEGWGGVITVGLKYLKSLIGWLWPSRS